MRYLIILLLALFTSSINSMFTMPDKIEAITEYHGEYYLLVHVYKNNQRITGRAIAEYEKEKAILHFHMNDSSYQSVFLSHTLRAITSRDIQYISAFIRPTMLEWDGKIKLIEDEDLAIKRMDELRSLFTNHGFEIKQNWQDACDLFKEVNKKEHTESIPFCSEE